MKTPPLHLPKRSHLLRGSFLIALGRRLALPLLFPCAALLVQPCAATPFQWEYTGSLNIARAYHTATLLQNGMVLVAGGIDPTPSASVELYDPASCTWTVTGSLSTNRWLHTATLLPNGKVLAAGGYSSDGTSASAELYDPASGIWTATGSLNTARDSHTATLLPNGMVLVAGGTNSTGELASAELYDPASGTWTATRSLNTARYLDTATLLPNGRVLVAGGLDSRGGTSVSAELYDPASGTWTVTRSLNTARYLDTATLLQNGRVLVAGGYDNIKSSASAELYDPASGTWRVTGRLNTARHSHTASLLGNGQVLVAGGLGLVDANYEPLASAELYDPATGTWTFTGSLNTARAAHTITLLPNGEVLVAGGVNDIGILVLASAELYDTGIVVATHVEGRGAFDNQGNEVTFKFRATQAADGSKLGPFALCDPAAGMCIAKAWIHSLSITVNTADFSGQALLEDGSRVTFSVSVTDNGQPGTSDTISISLDNGYSASGTLTGGDIRIY